ncbi:MAG TPA: S46 family peptidase [Pyrinomonadaceae bacterium]|nr:S46 family peptidase [Pyrinomonadaceae bacterium]
MKRAFAFVLSLSLLLSTFITSPVRADEGMWTFDNPPLKQWKERYNFEPTKEWLDHVRLASVRLQDGGSGSFVSPNGLVMTNQHVAGGQLAKLSTKERDLVKDGFYARTHAEELKCPDLEINVLVSYEDVTKRVQGAVRAGATDREANEQRRAAIAAIEKESTDQTKLKSDVVTLYAGGEYWVYRYKKYTDVRLVFAPEEQIAFFGGDYDNFTYPRYNLDVTFLRVYENDQPAKTEHYFKWSAKGPADGEFVVLSGNPGSTNRLLTNAQLQFQRDLGNPLQMQVWSSRRAALNRYAALGTEQARRAGAGRRSLENSIKRLESQQAGLLNARLMGKKESEEKELRAKIAANPQWQQAYGSAWDQVATAYASLPKYAKRIAFTSIAAPSRLGSIASTLVRYSEEIRKPNERRYSEFQDARLEPLKVSLFSPAPIYPDLEEAALAAWLEEAQKTLGNDDPFIRAALNGSTPAQVAKQVITGTKLTDVAVRRSLFEGGADAIAKSDDPLIVLARKIEPVYRELRAWNEENILSVDASAGQRIAAARFAVYGKTVAPDATFTLRLSYGRALGYNEDTTLVPFKTTFYGLYDRAESFGEKPPYNLPARYKEGRNKFDLSTPFNFVYTADTIGGNSGSPVINRNAEVVGLNFDSNIQKLPNRYVYVDEEEGGRAVAVHSMAIIEALRKLYGAEKLADEITAGR